MARQIQEPVTTSSPGPGDMDRQVTKHPAFAQIAASRVSGRSTLYASDFSHNAYMTITIKRSQLNRDLNHDWHFGREQLIEVALSEAQWATFVSSPNMGDGVPCTLQWTAADGPIPGLPDPVSRASQFGDEMRARLKDSVDELKKAVADFEALGLPKGKTEAARDALMRAERAIGSSMSFVAESFDKHMETTVEKAKTEVHGYMTGALMRSGLDALSGSLPLQIEGENEEAPQ